MNDPAVPPVDPTTSPAPPLEATTTSFWRTLPQRIRLTGPMLGLLVVLGLFVLILYSKGQLAKFLSFRNIQGLTYQHTVTGVVALGMLLVMVSGGIDLSVGSVVGLVTVVTMKVFLALEPRYGSTVASLVAVMAGVGMGGLCGLLNGMAITRLRVTPFVVTLGMLSMARGFAYWLAERPIPFEGETPGWVTLLQTAEVKKFWLFDPGVWSLVMLALGTAVLLRFTVFGRYIYAIGSNEATARLCGIGIVRNKIAIYTLAGILTGWGGVLTFAKGNSGDPGAGVGLELEVIAAVVIGGASLSGGQGGVIGTMLGVLILAVLANGVSFSQVPIDIKYILIGAIIVVNTALSQWQRRKSE